MLGTHSREMQNLPLEILSVIATYDSLTMRLARVCTQFHRAIASDAHREDIMDIVGREYPMWQHHNRIYVRHEMGRSLAERNWHHMLFMARWYCRDGTFIRDGKFIEEYNTYARVVPMDIAHMMYRAFSRHSILPVSRHPEDMADIVKHMDSDLTHYSDRVHRNIDAYMCAAMNTGDIELAGILGRHIPFMNSMVNIAIWGTTYGGFGFLSQHDILYRDLERAYRYGTISDSQDSIRATMVVAMISGTLDTGMVPKLTDTHLRKIQTCTLEQKYLDIIDRTHSSGYKYLLPIVPNNKDDAITAINIILAYSSDINTHINVDRIRDMVTRYNIDDIILPMNVNMHILPHIVEMIPGIRTQLPSLLVKHLSKGDIPRAIAINKILGIPWEDTYSMSSTWDILPTIRATVRILSM